MTDTGPNGLVKIGRSHNHGYFEEFLNYEQAWEDGDDFILKSYSQQLGEVVFIKIRKSVLMEVVIGTDLPDIAKGESSS